MAIAWAVVVGCVALASGLAIEHPEYLSMPVAPFSLMFSAIFVGLPLALGLVAVQAPAFEAALQRGQSTLVACRRSIGANAIYACFLAVPLVAIAWLLGNQPTIGSLLWSAAVLVICSLVTSGLWLTLHLALRRAHA
jgi:hypothetical protein